MDWLMPTITGLAVMAVPVVITYLINRIKDSVIEKLGFTHGASTTKLGAHKVPGWNKIENAIQHKASVYLKAYNRGLDSDEEKVPEE